MGDIKKAENSLKQIRTIDLKNEELLLLSGKIAEAKK